MPSPMDSDSDSGHQSGSSSTSSGSSSRSPVRRQHHHHHHHSSSHAISSYMPDVLDAADGVMDGRFFGQPIVDARAGAGTSGSGNYYESRSYQGGFVEHPQTSAAAMLDAADGVMDGKFFGSQIVQGADGSAYTHAEFSTGSVISGGGYVSGGYREPLRVKEEVTMHRGAATVISDGHASTAPSGPRTISERVISSKRVGERLVSTRVLDRRAGPERVVSTVQVHSKRIPGSEREVQRRTVATQRIIQDRVDKTVDVPVETIQERLVVKDRERTVKVSSETLQVKDHEKVIYRDVKVPVEVKKEVLLRQEVKVPVYKTTEKIRKVPVERVIEKVVEQIVEKIIEVPVEHIRVEEVDVPFEVIVERIVEVPVPRIVEKVIHVPVEHIVEKITRVPVERVVEKIVHVPVERIVEQIVEVPVENIIEKIVEVEVPGTRFVTQLEPRAVDDPLVVVDSMSRRVPSTPLMRERDAAYYVESDRLTSPGVSRTPKRVLKV